MKATDAYKIILSMHPNLRIIKCVEYDSIFVFQLAPSNVDPSIESHLISGLLGVDKNTGQVRDFKPFHMSPDEYSRGKEVRM